MERIVLELAPSTIRKLSVRILLPRTADVKEKSLAKADIFGSSALLFVTPMRE